MGVKHRQKMNAQTASLAGPQTLLCDMRFLQHLLGLLRDCFRFAWVNKAWWLIPTLLLLLALALLVSMGQGGISAALYTIF